MKAKFGALMVDGSGKIGGHVVAKNRGGTYMRTKKTPLNPNTVAQANARSILASLSTAWSSLTDAQRKSFNDAVSNFAKTDVFGDLRNPSGINLFVKLNANLINSGQPQITTAPEKIEVPYAEITSIVIDLSAQTIVMTANGTSMDTSVLKIQATSALSAGVSFVKSQLRTISSIFSLADSSEIYVAYVAKFGIPAIGQNIQFSIAPITETGQQGIAQKIKATVVA